MKKLIAVDVDGTLVNSDKVMTPRTRKALMRAIEEGHHVMIVSGRQTAGLLSLADELDFSRLGGLLSAFNGGMIYDFKNKKTLANHTLDLDLAREILDYSKDLDLELMVPSGDYIYTDKAGQSYVEKEARILEVGIKVVPHIRDNLTFAPNKFLFAQDPDKIDGEIAGLIDNFGDETVQVKSSRFYHEIMPLGLSKGNSLKEAADLLGVAMEDVIAFGDEMNDMSMLEVAGTSVAMGNAVDPVKEVADHITLSNDEDGIAHFLEKHILRKDK